MRIVILAFDGLDYQYLQRLNVRSLLQKTNGNIDLTKYRNEGGLPGGSTPEVFGCFLTGRGVQEIKPYISGPLATNSMIIRDKLPTIFDLTDFIAVDVPMWDWGKEQRAHGYSIWKAKVNREEREHLKVLYSLLWEEKLEMVIEAVRQKKPLTMCYFWFTDHVGHMFKGQREQEMSIIIAGHVARIIKGVGGPDALYLFMSDHGNKNGGHDIKGAFWSLSHPLLKQKRVVPIESWYGLIEEWLNLV